MNSSTTGTITPSPMLSQSTTHEALKQINMTLQDCSSHFPEIKTSIIDLKTSVDQINMDMANFNTKFQEMEM